MNVLDFLLDNWFLTIIILWFLFGLFGRGNREKAQREQHRHPAAERRLERQQETLRTQTDRVEEKRKLSDSVRQTVREFQGRVEEMEAEWHRQQEPQIIPEIVQDVRIPESPYARENEQPYRRDEINAYERKVKQPYERRIKNPYRTGQRLVVGSMPIDRDSLKQGVIWAEVLGKPRAKRPYRPPYWSSRSKNN